MLQVVYDQAQDLTLVLNKVDKILLLSEKTKCFYDCALRGFCKTLEANVFLAYTSDTDGIIYFTENSYAISRDLEGMGRIVIPNPENRGSPWLIGLSDNGKDFLGRGWPFGIRYNGSNKLFIKVNEFER